MEDDRSRYLHPPESDFLQPDDAAASLSSGLGSSSASAAAGAPQSKIGDVSVIVHGCSALCTE